MALCIACRRNKTFERGAKLCSDCQAEADARAAAEGRARDAAPWLAEAPPEADGIPDAEPYLWTGLVGAGLGAIVMLANAGDRNPTGFLLGAFLLLAGLLLLLVAVIAHGVAIGIAAADRREGAATRRTPGVTDPTGAADQM